MLWPQVASIKGFRSRKGIYTVKKFNGIDGTCNALWPVGLSGKAIERDNEDKCTFIITVTIFQ